MNELDLNSGALAPVKVEQTLDQLEVTGELPEALRGTLIRNGPNPLSGRFEGSGVLAWWPEAAMLHAVALNGVGNARQTPAHSYRNRWVRTQNWATHNGVENALNDATFPASNPNVSLLNHGGELLALAEGAAPVAIDTTLASLGSPTRHPDLVEAVTAHPKVDPVTGELMSFRANWEAPFLRYNVQSRTGEPVHSAVIDVPEPAMMHDMAITASQSIFLDLNVAYDFSLFAKGHRIPICWQNQRSSRLGVIPRRGSDAQTRWVTIEPCFIQHVINAYDKDDNHIVLDVMRYPHYLRLDNTGSGFLSDPLATPWRYHIDLLSGDVEEHPLCHTHMELPRINERRTGLEYQFAYAVEQPSNEEMRGICKLDVTNGDVTRFELPPGDQNSEPIFVPNPDSATDAREDEGWVITCVYRQASDTTDVVVLDATDIASPPLATVHLPCRIPAGFHGIWVDAGKPQHNLSL